MRINTSDGSIAFRRATIRPTLDRERFLATAPGKDAKAKLIGKEWWHVTFKPEEGISAKLLYRNDRLQQVFILMEMPSDRSNQWTNELERQRKGLHDQWLNTELGAPPYQYAWGDVVSEFDQKGCVSEIIVTYAS
jgi:hypothetical protein